MLNSSTLFALNSYVKSIRNESKRQYAKAYAHWLNYDKHGSEPERGSLSVMGAQAVRLAMGDIVRQWDTPPDMTTYRIGNGEPLSCADAARTIVAGLLTWTDPPASHTLDVATPDGLQVGWADALSTGQGVQAALL